MSRLRIALLNAAHDSDHTTRNFRRELDADLVEFHCPSREFPDSYDFDACVVTGSRASVYWEEPWIEDLKAWVDDAVEAGLPFLGVCYGHQLLADVLGGRVEPMDDYEIGYRQIERVEDSPLLEGIDEDFTAFTTHSDRVGEVPPGASVFAENDFGVHGFRKGHVFAVQFHPEYDTDTAETVTRGKEGQITDERIQRVVQGITEENYAAACETKQLFDNFTDYVRTVRDDQVAAD